MKYVFLLLSMFSFAFAKDDGLDCRQSTIPVLDLQDYFNEETKNEFIQQVRDASHKTGFFALKNTGVNQEIIDNLYTKLEEFFAFDKETKLLVDASKNGAQRGYTAIGREAAKGESAADGKEYYMMGREISAEESQKLGYPVNVWPEFCQFKGSANAFYAELEKYSELLQGIFSQVLELEESLVGDLCTDGDTSCRMIHYPVSKSEGKAIWAGAHTDITMFTILPKATCEGLEVCDDNGNWIPVFIKEDAMIVNVGDFLEILSNGYLKSAPHRVKAPKNMKTDRYSCVHFVHPKAQSILYPFPKWIEKTGGKAKYIKATRNEMLWERLADMGIAPDFMLKDLADWKVLERLMTVGRASPDAMKAVYEAGYASEEVKEALEKSNE